MSAKHFSIVAAAVLALFHASITAEETTPKLDLSTLKGSRACLSDPKNPMLIVSGKGATIQADLPVGRIQIAAYFRYNNKGTAYRQTEFEMTVLDQQIRSTVDNIGNGQPLLVRFVNTKKGKFPISISGGTLTVNGRNEMSMVESKVLQNKKPDADDGSDILGEEIPDAAISPVPTLLLDRIEITRLSGAVIIASITSDRITYKPGMKGTCTVTLENLSDTVQTVKLKVDLACGLESTTNLFNGDVPVDKFAKLEKTIPFDVGGELWGRGISVAAATPEGSDSGAHAFSVVTHPYQVAFHGAGGTGMNGSENWTPEQAEIESEKIVKAGIQNYCNIYEDFAWAPCDYSKMTVDNDEPFFSGQTQYCKKRSSIQIMNKVCHKYGVSCITYGKACASGLPGLQYALSHPEQMNVFAPAGFAHESISVDVIDRMLENRYRKYGKNEDFWQSWISCWVGAGNLAAAEHGCDEIVASAKMFGWDGVRYDGHFDCWQDPSGSARMVKHCVDRIQSQLPNFAIGYNYMGPRHNKAEGAFTDVELAACARGGGLVMSEYYRELLDAKTNIGHLQAGGDMVRLHGGYWLAILDDRSIWNSALVIASGARPMGGSQALFKFGTRFSSFIFDPSMRRLQAPERILKPANDPGFRWESFDYEKELDSKHAALILQLVNVSDKLIFGRHTPPIGINPPRENVVFELNLPAGYSAESVFASDDYNTFQPMPAKLEGTHLTIPRVSIWTFVMVRLSKNVPPKSLAQICEVPLKIDGVQTGDAVDDRASLEIGASVGAETLKKAQQEKVLVTPAIIEAILAQAPAPDFGPGEKAYQPADFSQHNGSVDEKTFKGNAAPLVLKRNGKPDIHYVCGVLYQTNRMQEAIARIKGARVTTSALEDGKPAMISMLSAENKDCISGFPKREGLAETDLLILDNIPAVGISQQERRDVLEFVRGGGSLLVLGGWYALSKGSYEGSFLEDALPVMCKQSNYLCRLKPEGGNIVATPDFRAVLQSDAPDFGTTSSIEWTSHIKPKGGAKVLLTAGGQPLMVTWTFGKGRVVVFGGTHSGLPETPYWKSDAWPKVMTPVLQYLLQGSEAVTPPDPQISERVNKTIQALDDATMGDELGGNVLEQLKDVLSQHTEKAALFSAEFLLNKPKAVDSKQYPALIEQIVPCITAAPEWERLGMQYIDAPPMGLENLVASIAATADKQINVSKLIAWKDVDQVTLLRCIAAAGDKAGLPYLEKINGELDATEKNWDVLSANGQTVTDVYTTHLVRPFVYYAMLKLGKRDDHTVYGFCHGCLELPYYAWRQHWVLWNCYDLLKAAGQNGDPNAVKAAQLRIEVCWKKITTLERAASLAAALFTPEVVGMDEIGKKNAARAIHDADCNKSLPLCLDFIQELKADDLKAFSELKDAKLDGVKYLYRSLIP